MDVEIGDSSGIVYPEPSHKGIGLRHANSEGWEEIIRGIVEGVEFLQSGVGSVFPPVTYRAMEKDAWRGIHDESYRHVVLSLLRKQGAVLVDLDRPPLNKQPL
jgi:hypothetical protein